MSSISSEIQALVDKWLEWDFNSDTKAEIEQLVRENNEGELKKRLGKRIAFGTAGMSPTSSSVLVATRIPCLC